MNRALWIKTATFVCSWLLLGGCDSNDRYLEPEIGDQSFISADDQQGNRSQDNEFEEKPSEDAEVGSDEASDGRTVEEGDIYRVLGDNLILNLNSYKGLQVIDFSDPQQPSIVGNYRVSGYPVEMYVVDNQAVVLLNYYQGYYGNRADVEVDSYQGGLVLTVDISDPQNPQPTDAARIPGNIITSRLTRGSGKQALYIAANNYGQSDNQTVVRSFSVGADGTLTQRSTIDLGGYVADIQATTKALLVARHDWTQEGGLSTVALIDITNPDGLMIEGAQVVTQGRVQHKSNMDLYLDVLRVASSSAWSQSNTNHLETFNVSDIHNPIRIDHETFGVDEQLYATLFLKNKAFFVTYLRVDPFHAFSIDDQGQAEEKNEYIVSGWNDFFRPVMGETRLIGIGVDDTRVDHGGEFVRHHRP